MGVDDFKHRKGRFFCANFQTRSLRHIGWGGTNCARADHGTGIREVNEASFIDASNGEDDFGSYGDTGLPTNSAPLYLWIR